MIPMNWHSSHFIFGEVMFLIASIFLDMGCIPSWLIHYPRYSKSSHSTNDFLALTFSPAFFCRWKTISRWCKWSCQSDFVVINRSSIYILTYSRSPIKDDIFSWKISGLFNGFHLIHLLSSWKSDINHTVPSFFLEWKM